MASTRIPLSRADEALKSMQQRLEMSTAEIGLTVRTTNCLEERGIFTVRDLLNCTREDLLGISNFGEKTLEEVYKALESIGFALRVNDLKLSASELCVELVAESLACAGMAAYKNDSPYALGRQIGRAHV